MNKPMTTISRPRLYAAAGTAIAAILALIVLRLWVITYVPQTHEWPPRHDGEVTLMPEEVLVEVVHEPVRVAPRREDAAPAKLPEKQVNKSTPAPETGHHTTDRGPVGDAPATVTTKTPSPVKQQVKEKPAQTGPTKEELEQQRLEEARRKANSATASAFQRSQGKNNTQANGKQEGDTGRPDGRSQSVNGTGTGSVGGGWGLPRYAKVPATVTGSIKVKVTVDRKGNATKVAFVGGDAPAATDTRLRQAVENEVKSRRFTRPNADDAPETATAYITYVFK